MSKTAAEIAQEQRELEVKQKQQVFLRKPALRRLVSILQHPAGPLVSYNNEYTTECCERYPDKSENLPESIHHKLCLVTEALVRTLYNTESSIVASSHVSFFKRAFCNAQEQVAEAARIAAQHKQWQQEQAAATARSHAEHKKRLRDEQLRARRMQQVVCLVQAMLPCHVCC